MINENIELKKYVCTMPFTKLDIFDNATYPCYINFVNTSIIDTSDIDNLYNSKLLYDFRKSVLNGEYEYCNNEKCPHLVDFIYNEKVSEKFKLKDSIDENQIMNSKFTNVNLNLDESCNLSCPSCRNSIIVLNSNKQKLLKIKLNKILDIISNDVEILGFTSVGDPFSSKIYVDFLENFDITKFPKLKKILLYTNAILFNESMWNRIKKSQEYIKELTISIDASTKETYEKIRRGGKWKTLINNINFLSTIPNIEKIKYILLVQDTNYMEMESFVKLIDDIPHVNHKSVDFFKLHNWGTFKTEEYKTKNISDKDHPDYDKFLIELDKVINYKKNSNIDIFTFAFIKDLKTDKK